MDNSPGLLSMPQEMLSYIGSFLGPRDLLSLSGTCHYLRKVFNDNFIWQKLSQGGNVGRKLDSSTGLVRPLFKLPENNTMEPLCEHRLCFCKQSRLLSNLRTGNFVPYSIPYDGYLSDFETQKHLCNRQITYKGIYLFTLDYYDVDSSDEAIKVFNIEQEPHLISNLKLPNHEPGYSVVIWFHVTGNKLAVCKDDWIDVYEIQLPDKSFPLIHSVKMNPTDSYVLNQPIVMNNLLLVENHTLDLMHVWDIETGLKICDIIPNIKGSEFSVLGYSSDYRYILLSVKLAPSETKIIPHIFVYNLELLKFTSFNLILSECSSKNENCGLVNESFVVFLSYSASITCSIHVYDHKTSAFLRERTFTEGNYLESANIINNCLVLPTFSTVKIINLKNLQIVWELEEVLSGNLVLEIPENCLADVGYMNISDLCHLIVLRKKRRVEVWDFEKRIRVLDLPVSACVGMNDDCSKIIVSGDGNLKVLNYW